MKGSKVLLFLLGVLAVLGAVWAVAPESVPVGGLRVQLPSYRRTAAALQERRVDVDSLLQAVGTSLTLGEQDTLAYYRDFLTASPHRILLPEGDYTYFDAAFRAFEGARDSVVRVVHYGDSQIEMDRISAELRTRLQAVFGGSGTGMFPPMSTLASGSVIHTATGALTHYTMYGDSLSRRAPHSRYGVMAQLSDLDGSGSVQFRMRDRNGPFRRVSLLAGHITDTLRVRLMRDTLLLGERTVPPDTAGPRLLTWDLRTPLYRAELRFTGRAELYGIALDGTSGVAVDNIPLRGSAGTLFTRIDLPLMRRSMRLDRTALILLQFGGNAMPALRGTKDIEKYMAQVDRQLLRFRDANPEAVLLFVGPSDMGRSVDGRIVTWPGLPELVDSLRSTCLRRGVAFWDIYRMMGGEGSMARWVEHDPPYAGPDHIHFTTLGAEKVGDALVGALLTCYDFYRYRQTLPEEEVRRFMQP